MAYLCSNLEQFINKKVGDGSDVAYVCAVTLAPPPSAWRPGSRVLHHPSIDRGTAIATFQGGQFLDFATGTWAAIFLSQDSSGIRVLAQDHGYPVHEEVIPWTGTGDDNSGDKFYVIE